MHGKPLDISKNLMRNLVLNLKPTDMFNVVLFSGASRLLNETSLPANEENIKKAVSFVDNTRGGGGTEVLGALKVANAIPRANDDVSRTFVIITDGYVAVEQEAFQIIRENKNNTNFFAFGIGRSVNRYLIEGMAFAGNGEPLFITSFQDPEKEVERFRNNINTPVLTRTKLESKGIEIYDVEPAGIPDLMAERPITIFGKYKGKAKGTLTLSGKTGRKTYKQSFDIAATKPSANNLALRYLWARERIKYLDYMENPNSGWWSSTADSSIPKEITRLGLKYGLMTKYTSFIAIDEVVVEKDGKQVTVKQPLPLPEGVSNHAVARGEEGMVTYTGNARRLFSTNNAKVTSNDLSSITTVNEEEEEIFTVVETQPQFPGGKDSLYNFFYSNLR
jgi:Ca-activated chloride channel family protein